MTADGPDVPVVRKTDGNYCLPNLLAKGLKGVSERTQFEASILSMVFILSGLCFSMVYITFFVDVGLVIKVMTVVNGLAGFVFLTSMLATQFQQYNTFLLYAGLLKDNNMEVKEDGKSNVL